MQPESFQFGASTVLIEGEHTDFGAGYEQGYEQHSHHYRQGGLPIETSTLLFLIRNGFAPGISEMWQIGYVVGWLAACYEGGTWISEYPTQGVS